MSTTFYRCYEQELRFIRQMATQFAEHYPATAGRLRLESGRSVDPHVERMIEAVSFLTARIQHKLDDDLPEMTDALLGMMYPHFLAPIPSLSVVQFVPDPANALPTGLEIKRHSRLHTQRMRDIACLFRTCYDVTLWPIEVTEAELMTAPFPASAAAPSGTTSVLRLELNCVGDFRFEQLTLENLRFHLNGDNETVARLYETIFNGTTQIRIQATSGDAKKPAVLLNPEEHLQQVGFKEEEALLPCKAQSFPGYRLLSELFAFPSKFAFFDLGGWEGVREQRMGQKVEIFFYLDRCDVRLQQEISASTFRLGCTPIINLFDRVAEPIALTHTQHEYRIMPDAHHQTEMEVYSVDRVVGVDGQTSRTYRPFYDYRYQGDWSPQPEGECFWYAGRRASIRPNDRGSDMFLTLVDQGFDPNVPDETALTVFTTCTNRDLPLHLLQSGSGVKLALEAAVPVEKINCLQPLTAPLRPPQRGHAQWKLISHLWLNHLSLGDDEQGTAALKEMLGLYDFSDHRTGGERAAINRQAIEGVVSISSQRTVGRIGGPLDGGFCRGVEITLELEEENFLGLGTFLFASVLERFFAQYVSINSFVQLVAKVAGQDEDMKRWQPRSGEMQLL